MKNTKHSLVPAGSWTQKLACPGHFSGAWKKMFTDRHGTGNPSASNPALTGSRSYPLLKEGQEIHTSRTLHK